MSNFMFNKIKQSPATWLALLCLNTANLASAKSILVHILAVISIVLCAILYEKTKHQKR